MSSKESFWTQRLTRFGHTGWGDPFIYAFDQMERIRLLKARIPAVSAPEKNALDFGCGTGDFSKLLLDLGFTVCGYDPFVQPQISARQFCYAKTLSEIPFGPRSVDLVLSVTVLDHMRDDELCPSLALISSRLKNDAYFLMLEYALDVDQEPWRQEHSNEYQAFRTLDQMHSILETYCLEITNVIPFPCPTFKPSRGYQGYSRSLAVRFLRRLNPSPSRWAARDRILRYFATNFRDDHPMEEFPASPLKLIESRPISSARVK